MDSPKMRELCINRGVPSLLNSMSILFFVADDGLAVVLDDIVDSHGIDVCAGVGCALAVAWLYAAHTEYLVVHLACTTSISLWKEDELSFFRHELDGEDSVASCRECSDIEFVEKLTSCDGVFGIFHILRIGLVEE